MFKFGGLNTLDLLVKYVLIAPDKADTMTSFKLLRVTCLIRMTLDKSYELQ